jgi:prevent-host-death family protein
MAIFMAIIGADRPMASYSVAEARNHLPRLIKAAAEGEEVVITRHGKPVAELRSKSPSEAAVPGRRLEVYEWLRAQRAALKSVDIDSVDLLNGMHDETED